MAEHHCNCECQHKNDCKYENECEEFCNTKPLAEIPVGTKAKIVKILPKMRGCKKFADIGLVPGTELLMEAEAPFGSLIRVRVMETSMAFHRDDAQNIMVDEIEKSE